MKWQKASTRKWAFIGAGIIVILALTYLEINALVVEDTKESIKIGFIGAMSGGSAKYGAYEAVKLAQDEINAKGGIGGKRLDIVYEDGKCDSKEASTAANKLINIDKVKIILGGHCTPESLVIAPLAEKNKVIMLASITSNPKLTTAGDYIFRTTPISTVQSPIIADLLYNKLKKRNLAIIYEQTDYAKPIAEKLKQEFENKGGLVFVFESYSPGTIDFRTIILKAKDSNADSLFISAQNPDSALNIMKQIKEQGINIQLAGNEGASGQVIIDKIPDLYEGFIAAMPAYDEKNKETEKFIKAYQEKYGQKPPFGINTAESYDAVYIVSNCLEKFGENIDKIKQCLYGIKDFDGASGIVTIDDNGDAIKEYNARIVKNGSFVLLS